MSDTVKDGILLEEEARLVSPELVQPDVILDSKRTNRKKKDEPATEAYEISSGQLIETLFAYLRPPVQKADFSKKGKCHFCGVDTESKNRHVCYDCLTKHRDEIVAK